MRYTKDNRNSLLQLALGQDMHAGYPWIVKRYISGLVAFLKNKNKNDIFTKVTVVIFHSFTYIHIHLKGTYQILLLVQLVPEFQEFLSTRVLQACLVVLFFLDVPLYQEVQLVHVVL